MLQKIEKILEKIFNFSINRPKLNLAIFFGVLLSPLYFIKPVPFIISLDDLIDQNFRTYENLTDFKDQYHDRSDIILLLESEKAFNKDELCLIKKWIAEEQVNGPQITNTFSFFSLRRAYSKGDRLLFPQIYTEVCEKGVDLELIKDHPLKSVLFKDAKTLQFFIELKEPSQGRFGVFDPTAFTHVKTSFENMVSKKFPHIKAYWSGTSTFKHFNFIGIQDVRKTNLMVMVCLILLLRFLFGTFKSSFILLGTLFLTCISIFIIMSVFDFPIDTLTNNLFLIMIIATIEDFIFLSHHKMKFPDKPWDEGFRSIILSSFFTSLTTVIGFLSLTVSDLNIIARFGFLAGIGAILEWYLVFSILPSFISLFKYFRVWTKPSKKQTRINLTDFIEKINIPKKISILLVFTMPLALLLIPKLNYQSTADIFFPPSHPYNLDTDKITKTTQIRSYLNLIFDSEVSETEMRKTVAKLSTNHPIKAMEDPFAIKDDFINMSNNQFIDLSEELFKTSLPRYFSEEDLTRYIFYFSDNDAKIVANLEKDVNRLCPDKSCWLAGVFHSYAEFNELILNTMIESLALCTLLIVIVLIFIAISSKKDLMTTIYIILSSLWGPMAVIFLVYFVEIPIFFITSISFAYLIGLTGDNAIQYLLSQDQNLKQNIILFGPASFKLAIIMGSLSLLFITAYFYPPRLLGGILSAGFTMSFIGDYWLLKGLLKNNKP